MRRIRVADSLRGFSLLGIFLANLLIFQYGLSGKSYIQYYNLSTFNLGIFHFIKIFIEGSFMPIFALLFGFSLDKLYQSMKNKNIKRPRVKLFRRAVFILIIGILHASFIWEGDILFGYALSMLIVIPFISLNKGFFKWITIIAVLLLIALLPLTFFDKSEVPENKHKQENYVENVKDIYQNGSYNEINNATDELEDPFFKQLKGMFGESFALIFLAVFVMEATFFGIGIYLSKSKWFEKDAKDFWSSKLFIYLILISLVLKSSYLWIEDKYLAENLTYIFGFLLAMGYVALFKYLYQKYNNHIIFRGFESLGKMSLTFYISQSVMGVHIFYGFGLGYFGKDTLIFSLITFIVLYIAQVMIALWYQKYLRYGPLEYILRVFTYLKFKPNKEK
ncbi:DUF418 domain-containing protein [Staphylococcus shinii]|uniref:DUF418 domain-containing protein n=1 Tax=Staphylococcus shinii TaxID=2912228 RepID=UPI000C321B27|nr:DUF418 domain-containing protein [Staphylococcus shinii]PKI09538.1 hypothetical protein CW747_08045 [Staphylococcus shinii]